ncbi:MAG: 3-oxoacyl-ACP synthase III family protein [Flavobacteriales bacterium]
MNTNIRNTKIDAIYACVPDREVLTAEYDLFSEEEARLFSKNTGIFARRVAPDDLTCSDLCYAAAEVLLTDFDAANDIDLLVFVSQSPDYFLPATSILLQERLGLRDTCMAFDVNLGCSGYVYGLQIVGQFIQSGAVRKALLLVGDKSTVSTSFQDKSTYPLFGDAGTATLLSFSDNSSPMFFNTGTDGSGKNAIIIEGGHSRNPYGTYSEELMEYNGNKHSKSHLHLEGIDIFNFALSRVPHSIMEVLGQANKSINEVDYLVLHQANGLITKALSRKLSIPLNQCLSSIERFGNTSSASIPLTLVSNRNEIEGKKEVSLVFSGFGVGFSWSSVCGTMDIPTLKLITYA